MLQSAIDYIGACIIRLSLIIMAAVAIVLTLTLCVLCVVAGCIFLVMGAICGCVKYIFTGVKQ